MLIRSLAAVAVGCGLLLTASVPANAQNKRGPSTPEERKHVLEDIHYWQANPMDEDAKAQVGSVLKWFTDVPDLTVHVCILLDKLPTGDKKDSATIFSGQFMGQAAYVLENAGKAEDRQPELVAGVESALRVYQLLLKANPKDRQPFLEELLKRREAGTLAEFVQEKAATGCK
jgi:hypothetical protein